VWAVAFAVPFVMAVLPTEFLYEVIDPPAAETAATTAPVESDALHDVAGKIDALEDAALDFVYSASEFALLIPAILSLIPGVLNGCLRAKSLLPAAQLPGWLLVFAAPAFSLSFARRSSGGRTTARCAPAPRRRPSTRAPPLRTRRSAARAAEAGAVEGGLAMRQESLTVATKGRGLVDVTADVARIVERSGVRTGLCVVFCAHTSASLAILENASPDAARDFLAFLARLAPDGSPHYTHDAEGPDDMAAHLRSAITRTSESIPIADGHLVLGTWQGLYLVEHRLAPHRRTLVVHVTGE